MTAKAIVHVTEVITVMVEFRAPKPGDLMWCVPHDATPEEALDHVLSGRDTWDSGECGYGYYTKGHHDEFQQFDDSDPMSRSRNIVVHVKHVTTIPSPYRLL